IDFLQPWRVTLSTCVEVGRPLRCASGGVFSAFHNARTGSLVRRIRTQRSTKKSPLHTSVLVTLASNSYEREREQRPAVDHRPGSSPRGGKNPLRQRPSAFHRNHQGVSAQLPGLLRLRRCPSQR